MSCLHGYPLFFSSFRRCRSTQRMFVYLKIMCAILVCLCAMCVCVWMGKRFGRMMIIITTCSRQEICQSQGLQMNIIFYIAQSAPHHITSHADAKANTEKRFVFKCDVFLFDFHDISHFGRLPRTNLHNLKSLSSIAAMWCILPGVFMISWLCPRATFTATV